MSAAVAEVLDEAAAVIEARGWTREAFESRDGRVCLLGALHVAEDGEPSSARLTDNYMLARRAVLDEIGSNWGTPSIWNDAPERTADEVIAALRNAAAAERVTP